MGRASFEYDEVGNTFYYVLVSFYAIILLPATYYFFPTNKVEEEKPSEHECRCEGCDKKRLRKSANKPWRRTKKLIATVALTVAWIIFAMIVKKTTEIEPTHKDYDPYQILGLDVGAESSAVKKAYRDLSKIHHPDRGGDPVFFDVIAKAYQALTDKEARENWEKYGNPDGPQATTFGIALPKWLVSKEYGLWVLAFYGLVFMVILPVVVGIWWYNSIKYSVDKVLLDTTRLYYYFIHKTPRMEIHRMIAVLSGSFEFNKQYNKEINERESDERELPRLMKSLPAVSDKGREQPLSMPYALKARILMHAYLSRMPLESEGEALDTDQRYVVTKILRLIEEMISVSHSLVYYSQARIPIETIENLQRLQPMFIQGLWQKNSVLLQLPHITEYNLQFLRKQRIHSCHDLAQMDGEKRRAVLRSLTDAEYRDVLVVLSMMPRLQIETKTVVEGEDDGHELTAGCVVTLKVTMKRSRLIDPQEAGLQDQHKVYGTDDEEEGQNGEESGAEGDELKDAEVEAKKSKPWAKKQQKAKKAGGKKKGGQGNKKQQKKTVAAPATPSTEATSGTSEETKPLKKKDEENSDSDSDDDEKDSDSDSGKDTKKDVGSGADNDGSDSEWEGDVASKKISLETKSVETHRVHAPFFPIDKFEWWWVGLTQVDKKEKTRHLVTAAQQVKTLVDEHTVDIRFAAPKDKGIYHYQLSVKSDSYMDAEYSVDVKLDVKEPKVIEVKYDDFDDEEEGGQAEGVSSEDDYTEGSDSDEE